MANNKKDKIVKLPDGTQMSAITFARNIAQMLTNTSTISSRSAIAARLGKDTYGGDRDIYQALGYPKELKNEDFINRYRRGDIARRINNAYPDECWKSSPTISDQSDSELETGFEKGLMDLDKKFGVWRVMKRFDRLIGLGRYAVLFLGFSDVSDSGKLISSVEGRGVQLNYVQPYGEENAKISIWETDPANPRFGKPKTYQISVNSDFYTSTAGTTVKQGSKSTYDVDWTRIIHVAEDLLENEIYGIPRMETIYNRLIDLEKIAGGSGEMFWRGARPGYVASVDPEAQITSQTKDQMREEFDEYEHNLRRILRLVGVEMKPMEIQVADPINHAFLQLDLIAAAFGIPKRILMGSERGELASDQDEKAWLARNEERRLNYCIPSMIRPFVDRLIEYGAVDMPQGDDYDVTFPSLIQADEQKQSEVAVNKSTAIRNYVMTPGADQLIPQQMFLTEILGWDEDQVKQADELREPILEEEELEEGIIPDEAAVIPEEE